MLRRAVASLALVLVGAPLALAQSLEYGPLLARGVDPDTMYVKWGFDTSSPATLHWRKSGAATYQTLGSPDAVDHELKLYGLPLDTQFDYYVSYGAAQTEPRSFGSCPTAGLPLDVAVLGDSRDGGARAAKIMQQVKAEAPDLILETGDIAPSGTFAEYLTDFIAIASDVVDAIPFQASPGNHDAASTLRTNYGRIFATPRDASEAWRSYYSFVCGNVRFVALDSNSVNSTTQLDFLTNELDSAKLDDGIAHVLVYFHHSPYSTGEHGDNAAVQTKWVPLFESAGSKVRLVFTGHDHIYARLGTSSDVMYIVTGGAGAPRYDVGGATDATTTFESQSIYNHVSLHIVGGLIQGTAIDDTGALIDTFSIGMATPPPDLTPPTYDLARPDLAVAATDDLAVGPVDPKPPVVGDASGCNTTQTDPTLFALLLIGFVALSSRSAARWAACRRR